jgi:hypothetical protein
MIASSEKAKRELNWKPQFRDVEAIVESAWHWSIAHPNGYPDQPAKHPNPAATSSLRAQTSRRGFSLHLKSPDVGFCFVLFR